jgi:hypothetical protein
LANKETNNKKVNKSVFASVEWFDEGCSELLDQRKQVKLQWSQDPSEIDGHNLNNVRREACRHFKNKKRKYLKDKTDELATYSKNKNIRDIYKRIKDFKRGFLSVSLSGAVLTP